MRNFDTQMETISISPANGLYDLSMLEEMDDNEYLVEILDTLLDESPREFAALKSALHAGDTSMVCNKAHKLKSSAGVIQAETLVSLLANIETQGKSGSVTNELNCLVENAILEYGHIERSIKMYVDTLR